MKISLHLLVAFFVFTSQNVFSQDWNTGGNTGTNPAVHYVGNSDNTDLSFRTNSTKIPMRLKDSGALGLGTTSPGSWFHVISDNESETFRTDVDTAINNFWRMYRNGTEYGRIYHLSGSGGGGTAFYVHGARGDLRLGGGNTGTAIPSFVMRGGSGNDAGYVGVGDYTNFSPTALFHIHQNSASTKADFHMTNASTGTTSADGFLVDVSHTSPDINFRQQENNSMIFYTGSAGGTVYERMRINGEAM